MLASFVLAFLAAAAPLAPAVLPPGNPTAGKCQGRHGPGDRIVCFVTFRGDPEFTSLSLSFSAEMVQDPGELPITFILEKSRKVAPGTYEVSDILPFATSGRCYLSSIIANVGPGSYRMYAYGRDYLTRIAIHFTEDPQADPDDNEVPKTNKRDVALSSSPVPFMPMPGTLARTEKALDDQPKPRVSVPPDEQVMVGGHEPVKIEPEASTAAKTETNQRVGELVEIGPIPRGPGPDLFPKLRSLQGKNRNRPCEGGNKPGDKITCYVIFDGDSAFTRIYLSFYNRDVPYEQSGLCNSLFFQDSKKISRRTYKVTGVLPGCADGNYILAGMQLWTLTGIRDYREGKDFINRFPAIHLDNGNQTLLPDIVSIGSDPPPQN